MSFVQLDPPALTFHPGFRGRQRLAFRIIPDGIGPVQVEVSAPEGGPFSWSTRLEHDGLLAFGAIEVEVEFDLDPAAPPVSGFVDVVATHLDGRPAAGSPLRCELRGNVPGVGPGALSIVAFVPDRAKSRLSGELLFIANNTSAELELSDCRFGEYTPVDPSLGSGYDDIFCGLTLRPRAATGDVLRLWRGGLPPYADPRLDLMLRTRGSVSPTARNTRDIAWIKNENGQLIDSCTYIVSASATAYAAAADVIPFSSFRGDASAGQWLREQKLFYRPVYAR
jgi:hypothetical protein